MGVPSIAAAPVGCIGTGPGPSNPHSSAPSETGACVPTAERDGDGVDSDCDGTDGTAEAAADLANVAVTGSARMFLGEVVACTENPTGDFDAAAAMGSTYVRSSDYVYGPGRVIVLPPGPLGQVSLDDPRVYVAEGSGKGVRKGEADPFGTVITFADVDGDPVEELLADIPSYDTDRGSWGGVRVFRPRVGGLDTLNESEQPVVACPDDLLGWPRAVGDLDGDGRTELAVARTHPDTPELFVLDGAAPSLASPLANLASPEPGSFQGGVFVRDLDGDGVDDLSYAEPLWQGRGRVRIALGPLVGTLVLGPSEILGIRNGPGPGATALAVLGVADLNHDGSSDLVVGAPERDTSGERAGRLSVFFGPFGPRIRTVDDADLILDGEGPDANFGFAAAVGDQDGDGFLDLIVGAPSYPNSGPPRPGLVYVFRGPLAPGHHSAATADRVFGGAEAYDRFGRALAACDLDGDGRSELVVGAPGTSGAPSEVGRGYVLPGG
jgi:hypothetical protein